MVRCFYACNRASVLKKLSKMVFLRTEAFWIIYKVRHVTANRYP